MLELGHNDFAKLLSEAATFCKETEEDTVKSEAVLKLKRIPFVEIIVKITQELCSVRRKVKSCQS